MNDRKTEKVFAGKAGSCTDGFHRHVADQFRGFFKTEPAHVERYMVQARAVVVFFP
jgi:hypothetical protein